MSVIRYSFFLFVLCSCQRENPVVHGDPQPDPPPFWAFFTVDGVDADNDGIRDDVEIWINETAKGYNLNKALKQVARGQLSYRMIDNSLTADLYLHQVNRDQHCLSFIYMHEYPKERKRNPFLSIDLSREILNNPWRDSAFNVISKFRTLDYQELTPRNPVEFFTSCDFEIANFRELLLKHRAFYSRNDSIVRAVDDYLQREK